MFLDQPYGVVECVVLDAQDDLFRQLRMAVFLFGFSDPLLWCFHVSLKLPAHSARSDPAQRADSLPIHPGRERAGKITESNL